MIFHIYLCTEHKRVLLTYLQQKKPGLAATATSIHDEDATGGKCEAVRCYLDPGFLVELTVF